MGSSGAAAAYFRTAADADAYVDGRPKVRSILDSTSCCVLRPLLSVAGTLGRGVGRANARQYPRALFDAVLSQHTGDRGVLLDLGCGPGVVGASV